MTVLSGTVLVDRYRLQAKVGRGGMGAVYQGYDLVLVREDRAKVEGAISLLLL